MALETGQWDLSRLKWTNRAIMPPNRSGTVQVNPKSPDWAHPLKQAVEARFGIRMKCLKLNVCWKGPHQNSFWEKDWISHRTPNKIWGNGSVVSLEVCRTVFVQRGYTERNPAFSSMCLFSTMIPCHIDMHGKCKRVLKKTWYASGCCDYFVSALFSEANYSSCPDWTVWINDTLDLHFHHALDCTVLFG